MNFGNEESLERQIEADADFIAGYFAGVYSPKMYAYNFKKHDFGEALLYTTQDIFIGAIGVIVFSVQIILNSISLALTKIGKGISEIWDDFFN